MKYSKELVNALKQRILVNADSHPNDLVQYSMENLSLSKNTVLKYIDELLQEQKLIRTSVGRYPSYALPKETKIFSFSLAKNNAPDNIMLSEDSIASEVFPFIGNVPFEISQILDYAFMEITNNAIEHSEATKINIKISKSITKLKICIADNGIGIFKKIKNDLHLLNEKQSIIELSKGKFTSNPEHHSGEGIFFSSKLCDEFYILSDGLIFSPQEDIPEKIHLENINEGTKVIFIINFNTKKVAKEIFDEFAGTDFDNPTFKTIIQLRYMQMEGMSLTSRSQARRLLTRFEKFTTVVLDFSDVPFIGQGFADEIFRVYSEKNPATKIEFINASDQVQAMIAHVKAVG